ncbi:hypothetical protein VZT92_018060 [Zoarces viviparus]|uniref:Small membrane A-kinase anchor protein n=1 Tax=Zoarces viviparus TaxID=48416 RepID=A0AAW1EP76_ZOAVI
MGCTESRCRSWDCSDKQEETVLDKQEEGETKAFLTDAKETKHSLTSEETPADGCSVNLRPVTKPMLDLAQKMSEDIVAQALQLCWELDIHYKEWLFIDTKCEYVT